MDGSFKETKKEILLCLVGFGIGGLVTTWTPGVLPFGLILFLQIILPVAFIIFFWKRAHYFALGVLVALFWFTIFGYYFQRLLAHIIS